MSVNATREGRSACLRDQLSIVCSAHSCLFSYVQLSLRKSFQSRCETCWSLYEEKPVVIATFPCPLSNSNDVEYDIIIVPAKDSCFSNSITDLHIAVSHRLGLVLDFGQRGLEYKTKEDARSKECLRLHLIDELKLTTSVPSIERCWDDAITKYLAFPERNRWLSSSYRVDTNNCFDFVLHFVETLIKSCGSDATNVKSKDLFCKRLVEARIEEAALYLSLRGSIVDDKSPVFIEKDRALELISRLNG